MAATMDELTKGMVAWYDETATQDAVWGDYLHHGYYGLDEPAHVLTNQAAEQRMVDEVLKFAAVSDDPLKRPKNVIDVGCGFGGAAIYLAKKYGAKCCGINLSPAQIQKAKELAAARGLGDMASFVVGDALNQPFSDGQFDLVWSMEVIEHTTDKLKCIRYSSCVHIHDFANFGPRSSNQIVPGPRSGRLWRIALGPASVDQISFHPIKFVSELARIAAPGATIIFTSCCNRDLSPGETSLKPDEKNLIDKIRKTFHQSSYVSPSDIVEVVRSLAVHDIKMADFSENVIPYFRAIVQSQRTWQGLTSMLLNGWTNFEVSQNWPRMLEAYEKGVTKYIAIVCHKPK